MSITTLMAVLPLLLAMKVAGRLLGFGATVVAWVDGEGLLPSIAFCLV
jgi:hypothetical protein